MGFNLSGIVVNENFKDNLEELTNQFNWNLQFVEEINFETASENWKAEGICDIYFSEQGTLLFIDMDMCVEPWSINSGNTLTFALSETSMAFNLNYCVQQEIKRSIMEAEGERMTDEGERLPIERSAEDTSEIIWGQIGEVLGKTFWSIEPNEKAYRYKFIQKAEAKSFSSETEPVEKIYTGEEINLMIEDYIRENDKILDNIKKFIQDNKHIKNRHGKLGYLYKTEYEISKKNIEEIENYENVIKVEKIASQKYGTGYIVTFRVQKQSFFESLKNLFTKR
jgi:hypothetical protein